MKPRIKFGLIAGAVGLVLNVCVAAALGLCGPVTGLLAGGVAGFLAAQQEKAASKGDGARLGAVSGGIAGALVLVGQLIGGISALAYIQYSGMPLPFGQAPDLSDNAATQLAYYLSGLGTGMCIGIGDIIAAAIAGAVGGYFGTPTPVPGALGSYPNTYQPTYQPPTPSDNSTASSNNQNNDSFLPH